ncbi:hypothetical protein BDV27DRAFT_165702 [Aspergillus caelatus]|uniref:PBP domain-containing protein n=2 Tax=Aspergillus subgen. Circumdati TaxID=2720871 RepID=A0A5N6ZZK6_9EURO|nr:uncharacterized protein BDV27DRAFT_165702 [Aspergillus caelatus]KAE8363041.1 hypothetical protein BDV27DRAFT_165702 [Aspergillus caelatus]KAE8414129.1 hypothetical protein BDV36DRAFT_303605 [Aspergillus pseudocaelatus]
MRFSSSLSLTATVAVSLYNSLAAADTYDGGCKGDNPIKLRIGNGGAGQSGLVKELATHFIKNQTNNCQDTSKAFTIEWVKGDTTETINNLKSKKVDIGITYHKTAEQIAINNGFASGCKYKDENTTTPCFGDNNCQDYEERPCYTFRDHFYLAGPKNNTADIQDEDDITETFSKLYNAGENGTARFLSRFDKSATNIKDSELWIAIGQVPWAIAYSKWYHQYMDYPIQALTASIKLGEYTVTDRGTYLTLSNTDKDLADQLEIYKRGDEYEELLNPADIITSKDSDNKELAQEFVQWVLSDDGQDVIANFHKEDGYCLYKGFPTGDGGDVEASDCKWELS